MQTIRIQSQGTAAIYHPDSFTVYHRMEGTYRSGRPVFSSAKAAVVSDVYPSRNRISVTGQRSVISQPQQFGFNGLAGLLPLLRRLAG